MAYTLKVGTCSCENNVVDKSGKVTLGQDISCVMVNTDSLNPIFKVEGSRSESNYCYCSEFKRYYFIESVESLAGGHCLYHCHVDVLYTYRTQILGLSCFVSRNEMEDKWNRDMTDRSLPVSNRRIGISRDVSADLIVNPMEDAEFLLQYF